MLGPLAVHTATGASVRLSGPRLRRLTILLALDANRVVGSEQLVSGLWGNEPPAGAGNALQALVSRLRRALLDAPIESNPTGYRLVLPPEAVDVVRFERLAGAGRDLLRTDPERAADILTEALDLWRGPALSDLAGVDAARGRIARLEELRLIAAEGRIDARLALGDGEALVPELRDLVTAQPTRERPVGQLIRALRAAGRPAEALAAYDRLRTALADTLGTDPSAELRALHLELLRPAWAPARPGSAPAPTRTSLPAPLTSFVGREDVCRRIIKLVAGFRLTTLTGPGGAGKTRLAIEAARTLVDQTPDGVWLVELAPVTDPAEVAQTVLATLGLREQPLLAGGRSRVPPAEAADPVNRLIAAIGTRRPLLVLDNCEHLVEAAASLADRLLAACPGLRVLATSREPLGITGEALCPVEPLPLPPTGVGPDEALTYPAVRLLADRGAAVRPGYEVDDDTVATAVRICRSLDGMPLAIELAAARFRSMSPAQVATRLDDRFRLLTGGSRTALPRHQTLRAVVDWSWELLDDAERALWRRLAVFTGGARLETVERVCAGPDLAAGEVFDRLTRLVDKSLVVSAGDGEPRYRMLETIRDYGLARLVETGEADEVRRAHAAEFVDLAETADPGLRGPDQLRWMGRLVAEHDNLQAALRWSVRTGDAATAVRFVAALGWYWWLRGHRAEGVEQSRQALALPGADQVAAPIFAHAYVAAAMNVLAAGQGDLESARRWMLTAARLAEPHRSGHPMLRLIGPMAAAFESYFRDPELRQLRELFEDDDPWVAAVARMFHAHSQLNVGLPDHTAEVDLLAALAGFRSIGERWGIAFTLSSVADVLGRRGEHARAIGCHEEALVAIRELGTAEDVPEMQVRLAHELWQVGERDRAMALLAEAAREAERVGSDECRAAVAHEYGEIHRCLGDWVAAREHLARTDQLLGGMNVAPQWRSVIRSSVGAVDAAEGRLVAAREAHDTALDIACDVHDAPVIGVALVGFADLALRTGRPDGAAVLLGAAAGVRGDDDHSLLDRPRVAAAACAVLGEVAFAEAYTRGRTATADTVRKLVRVTLGG